MSFVASFAFAEESIVFKTTIEKVDIPKDKKLATLIFAHHEGRVLRVNTSDKALVKAFSKARSAGREIQVEISDNGTVIGASLLNTVKKKATNPISRFFKSIGQVKAAGYEPSVVTENDAVNLFESMNGRTKKRSQCFNRAHVWAYDLWQRNNVKSMKVFLFFTTKYIREYNFHWWFHVTPFVYVNTKEGIVEKTLDYSFAEEPLSMQPWIDLFMHDSPNCPEVKKYSEYERNQESKYCYLIKTPMYVWEPNNIEAMETEGKIPTSWDYNEIYTARKQAF